MRSNERQGFASIPRRRRRRSVPLPVHDLERQRELVVEFVAPLVAKRRRGQDEHAADAPPEQQFGEDQAGLDGLAEADVVGDQ